MHDDKYFDRPTLNKSSLVGGLEMDKAVTLAIHDALQATIQDSIEAELTKLVAGLGTSPQGFVVNDLVVKGSIQIPQVEVDDLADKITAVYRRVGLRLVPIDGSSITNSDVDVPTAKNIGAKLIDDKLFTGSITHQAVEDSKKAVQEELDKFHGAQANLNVETVKAKTASVGTMTVSESIVLSPGAIEVLVQQLTPGIRAIAEGVVDTVMCGCSGGSGPGYIEPGEPQPFRTAERKGVNNVK